MTTKSSRAMQILMSSAFGAAMPVLMFAALHEMTTGGGAELPTIVAHEIEFTRLIHDTLSEPKRRWKKPPPPTDELPPLPPKGPGGDPVPPTNHEPMGPTIRAVWDPHTIETGPSHGIDADPQPIVRIPPEYPINARGEGWVLVQFDISPAGTVTNASVIAAKPHGMFEKNALRAIERWRYRPAVVEGRAVERRGLQVMLRFELEKA